MSELIAKIIASDLRANEYKASKQEQIEFLSNSAAERIVALIVNSGYRIVPR